MQKHLVRKSIVTKVLVLVSAIQYTLLPKYLLLLLTIVFTGIANIPGNGVPAEPKREMALCRRMRVTRSSVSAVLIVDTLLRGLEKLFCLCYCV